MTFEELADEALVWSEEHRPKGIRTVRGRMKFVASEFGKMQAEDITPQLIDAWITAQEKWTPATKNRYRATISLVYRQGMRNNRVSVNPAWLVAPRPENNGRVRYLQADEELKLRRAMARYYPTQVPAQDIAMNTGMRKSEQFSLTWDAIDFRRREIVLEEMKNGSARVIPINYVCGQAFRDLLKRSKSFGRDTVSGHVFLSTRGMKLENPRAWFEEVLEKAKITDFRWHDLRHTFCSRLAIFVLESKRLIAYTLSNLLREEGYGVTVFGDAAAAGERLL